eukprot:s2640_g4.t4
MRRKADDASLPPTGDQLPVGPRPNKAIPQPEKTRFILVHDLPIEGRDDGITSVRFEVPADGIVDDLKQAISELQDLLSASADLRPQCFPATAARASSRCLWTWHLQLAAGGWACGLGACTGGSWQPAAGARDVARLWLAGATCYGTLGSASLSRRGVPGPERRPLRSRNAIHAVHLRHHALSGSDLLWGSCISSGLVTSRDVSTSFVLIFGAVRVRRRVGRKFDALLYPGRPSWQLKCKPGRSLTALEVRILGRLTSAARSATHEFALHRCPETGSSKVPEWSFRGTPRSELG